MQDMKDKTKRLLFFTAIIIVYFLLYIAILLSNRLGEGQYDGVFLAFQFMMCLFLVWLDYKSGVIIAYLLMGFSLFSMVNHVIRSHDFDPLPGICNLIIYAIVLGIICIQFRNRDMQAVTDFLTGLKNRRGLYKLLKNQIENEKPFHVVYIDLGNFKLINDNYGHKYGDELLRVVSDRMKETINNNGILTRIGGDEFVLVLDGKCNVREMTEKVLHKVCEKITLNANGTPVDSYITAFAGISSYPTDAKDPEDLIKFADIAMYEASKNNREQICFFNRDMEQYMVWQMELENLIKEGLEHDYFYLEYQPQYRLEGKRLRGFESLLRMKTPEGKFVSPGDFIPVAEKGELILQIDDYVLRRAMKEYKDIVEKAGGDLVISVNVSAKNIGSVDFADKVKAILEETKFPAKNLEIEITEYCLVQSVEVTINNIIKLREYGVQFALDDFGTGYTSLSYLAKMPINLLKVDKSLVDDIEKDEKSREFVNAVISMGHLMGCEVISEGVESQSQLDLLGKQNCDLVQGYVWGKPLKYEVARELSLKNEG